MTSPARRSHRRHVLLRPFSARRHQSAAIRAPSSGRRPAGRPAPSAAAEVLSGRFQQMGCSYLRSEGPVSDSRPNLVPFLFTSNPSTIRHPGQINGAGCVPKAVGELKVATSASGFEGLIKSVDFSHLFKMLMRNFIHIFGCSHPGESAVLSALLMYAN